MGGNTELSGYMRQIDRGTSCGDTIRKTKRKVWGTLSSTLSM